MCPVKKTYSCFSTGSLPSSTPMALGAEAARSSVRRTSTVTVKPGSARTLGAAPGASSAAGSSPAARSTSAALLSRTS